MLAHSKLKIDQSAYELGFCSLTSQSFVSLMQRANCFFVLPIRAEDSGTAINGNRRAKGIFQEFAEIECGTEPLLSQGKGLFGEQEFAFRKRESRGERNIIGNLTYFTQRSFCF